MKAEQTTERPPIYLLDIPERIWQEFRNPQVEPVPFARDVNQVSFGAPLALHRYWWLRLEINEGSYHSLDVLSNEMGAKNLDDDYFIRCRLLTVAANFLAPIHDIFPLVETCWGEMRGDRGGNFLLAGDGAIILARMHLRACELVQICEPARRREVEIVVCPEPVLS